MATNKFIELQGLSDEDLQNEINIREAEYKQMKFDHAVRGLENPLKLREERKDLARLYTEKRARELKSMTPEQLAKRSKLVRRRRK
ncbi:MAG: 50S ribosomal protein L29 [Bacteroidota bacterium]